MYKTSLISLLVGILNALLCGADVIVVDREFNKTIDVMADMPSLFGPQLSMIGMKGLLHEATPVRACSKVKPPPPIPGGTPVFYRRWIALIHRGNCSFAEKVLNAQWAGYSGVIVMNVGSDTIEAMSAAEGTADNVTIPSVFIGQSDGDTLQMFFRNYSRFGLIITGELPNIESYLLPFAITVAVCFLGMLICMIIKCVRDYRRSIRHRLSWRALRRLPLHKFHAGDPYEVCAICLDDYMDGDKLRLLPCHHAYHSRCIDPWLTKRRRVCPVCKQKVRSGADAADDTGDSDSDTERSTSERAPLLHQATQASGGTFSNNRENPFQRAARQVSGPQNNQSRAGFTPLEESDNSDDDENTNRVLRHMEVHLHDEEHLNDEEEHNEEPPEDLEVVTVTRSVRKNKKSKRSRMDEVEGSSGAESIGVGSSAEQQQFASSDDHPRVDAAHVTDPQV